MSLHATISSEAEAAIRKQRKKQAASSTAVAILILGLLLGVLSLLLLPAQVETSQIIVSYSQSKETSALKRKLPKETVKKKPSAPTSRATKIITSSASSPVNIPVPEIVVKTPSEDFGLDGDYGNGWGGGGSGGGRGSGGASFFGPKIKANRIAYVIDYSVSMEELGKDKLLRKELSRSIQEFEGSIDYQLIFFAGPGWVAGDKVEFAPNYDSKVTSRQPDSLGEIYKWTMNPRTLKFQPEQRNKGKLYTPKWLEGSESQIKKSVELINRQPLQWGTVWQPHLEMAMRMDPKPDVIFFMTDGLVNSGDVMQAATRISREARKKDIIIHTVAMMEPDAKKAMLKIAEQTGGRYTLIKEDGKPYDKDDNPVESIRHDFR